MDLFQESQRPLLPALKEFYAVLRDPITWAPRDASRQYPILRDLGEAAMRLYVYLSRSEQLMVDYPDWRTVATAERFLCLPDSRLFAASSTPEMLPLPMEYPDSHKYRPSRRHGEFTAWHSSVWQCLQRWPEQVDGELIRFDSPEETIEYVESMQEHLPTQIARAMDVLQRAEKDAGDVS